MPYLHLWSKKLVKRSSSLLRFHSHANTNLDIHEFARNDPVETLDGIMKKGWGMPSG